MATSPLVDIGELTTLLKQNDPSIGDLADDAYTKLMVEGASGVVRDAGDPNWVLALSDPAVAGEIVIPTRGKFIALYLAKRAWEDTGNLQRRTAGPLSETFFTEGVRGLELTDDEQDWLDGKSPDGHSGSTWMLRIRGTGSRHPFGRGDETPDGYSFAAGDMNFSHGMDMRGPAKADNW